MNQKTTKKDLGDLLVEKGIINATQLLDALDILSKEENSSRRRLPQVLVDRFKLNRDLVFKVVADYYAFRTLDIASDSMDDGTVGFIRKELATLPEAIRGLAHEHNVLPYAIDPERGNRLIVVTPDPTRPEAYKIARAFQNPKFEICYISASQWDELWKRVSIDRALYKDKESQLRSQGVVEEGEEDADEYEQQLEEEITRSGLVDLVESIFVDAVRVGASDIHVIPRGDRITEFHFRIDGKLTRWYTNNETRAEAVSAVVKDRARNLDRFERNTAQDGFAQLIIDRRTVRFRLSVLPVVGRELKNKFESIVIRVLTDPVIGMSLEELGFDSYAEGQLRKALRKPFGIVIVTGPTGSGKSTTLVAALRTIMDPSLNILTVEDPVEYFIEGARQVKLNNKLDFEGALRAILRHDPDIVMVGEIRDRLTAEIAVKLANTGHLTFSTLHTNDAVSAVARLYKMGIEPFLIAYSINMILSQRLVRKLCDRCKSPVNDPDIESLMKIGFTREEIATTKFYQPIGCMDCIRGFRGRVAIYEALYFTKEIRRLILDAGSSFNEEALREIADRNGMRTLRASALDLVRRGVTTIEEIAAATAEDE